MNSRVAARSGPTERTSAPAKPPPKPESTKLRGESFAKLLSSLFAPPPPPPEPPAPPPQLARSDQDGLEAKLQHTAERERVAGAAKEGQETEASEEHAGDRVELQSTELADAVWAHQAALVPPAQVVASEHVEAVTRHASIEQLAPALLKKMAWSGDGRRGTARLEVGSGRLAGAVLDLQADGREVRLEVSGLDPESERVLRQRLARGLGERGFQLGE